MLTSSGFMPLLSIKRDKADESGFNSNKLVICKSVERVRKNYVEYMYKDSESSERRNILATLIS